MAGVGSGSARSLFSCEGTVALVTGAGSGIGLACARALGDAGARVVLVGLGDIEAVAGDLRAEGLDALGVACDVTDSAALAATIEIVRQRYGRLDTVLANAGAALDEPGARDPLQLMDRMYALHVRSVVELASLALPLMADSGGGAFIVMSSIAGLRGNRVLSGYGATKAANAEVARNIAVQWGNRAIRANAISPGVIDTEFARPITADEESARARLAKTPLGRFGRPEEVAGAVVWLASPAGAFVSGQNIVIDGGTIVAD
ncbi:SDR family NAD(P)-dependent oxidoreductase [Microbacterium hominis]|uniref:SDR family oxidoreductase n=1 Tax=Microbacterium hominis TaxID=162426 RepID=A0A7D4UH46_9MICO|nr:SDR family oxidoreductase [Microbacterium hominis]QKJ20529.1 SDR family oxidoreductase [Microbacterium hominis]